RRGASPRPTAHRRPRGQRARTWSATRMMSRGQKTLIFLGAILAFSAALVGGALLFWIDGQPWPALFWAVVWGIAVVATIWGFISFRRESDPAIVGEGGHEVVEPPSS